MTTFLADLALADFPNVAIVDLRRDEAHVTARMANGVVVEADDVLFAIFSAIVEAQHRETRRRKNESMFRTRVR